MKELDFLPEWYKDRKRRHSMVRKQYVALAAVFLLMMAFNLTALHRAGRVAAAVARHEQQRMKAEAVVYEFNRVTGELNRLKTKATLVRQIDPRIDVAAILAEISHIVDKSIVLSRIELVAEPFSPPQSKARTNGTVVRTAAKAAEARPEIVLGNVKLRIALAGIATGSARVADLVCRLDESLYFQQVRPAFGDGKKIQPGLPKGTRPQAQTTGPKASEMLEVTTFEITCYLANYEEIEGS